VKIFRAEVVGTERVTAGMIRIVLGGEDVADFVSTGVGDEYLRVFLPEPGEREPVLPFATENSWDYPEGVTPSPMRTYTVRAVDPAAGTLTIDFVVHEGGVAATWAQRATVGDVVGLNSPCGLYSPPEGLEWQLLLADATGLPAVGRLVEQAPAGVRTRVIVEVPDASHHQDLGRPDVDVVWVYGGNGHSQSRLDEILRSVDLPDGTGYVWFAGEAKVMRTVRKHLRHERGLPGSAYKVIGYWTDKVEEWTERWDAVDAETKQWLVRLWDDENRAVEEIEDEYFATLETLGL